MEKCGNISELFIWKFFQASFDVEMSLFYYLYGINYTI